MLGDEDNARAGHLTATTAAPTAQGRGAGAARTGHFMAILRSSALSCRAGVTEKEEQGRETAEWFRGYEGPHWGRGRDGEDRRGHKGLRSQKKQVALHCLWEHEGHRGGPRAVGLRQWPQKPDPEKEPVGGNEYGFGETEFRHSVCNMKQT